MSSKELRKLVDQLKLSHVINRMHSTPFFFNFANLQPDGRLHGMLLKAMPTLHSRTYPIRVAQQFIPDSIAKERLIYLTPNSPNRLNEFNANDVYVIGGLVDNTVTKPTTFAKANEYGLRTARLPLDHWVGSSKILTVEQMVKILLKIKGSGDIRGALQHVYFKK